jgi:anti-sigma-K factor RskA
MMAAGEDELDLLAGEYVLGTLDLADRQAVERRKLDSPELVARIAAWERRFAPLSDGMVSVTPPPQVWQRLRRTIAARAVPRPPPVPWWNRVSVWRGWAAAATAAACGLLILVLAQGRPTQLVAVLSDPDGRPLWVVRATGTGEPLLARPVDGAGAAGTVPQLWLAQGDGPPLSLGLLERDPAGRQTLTLPPGAQIRAGDTMAISLEPPGGSPTGRPTGPVVSHGVLLAEPL